MVGTSGVVVVVVVVFVVAVVAAVVVAVAVVVVFGEVVVGGSWEPFECFEGFASCVVVGLEQSDLVASGPVR